MPHCSAVNTTYVALRRWRIVGFVLMLKAYVNNPSWLSSIIPGYASCGASVIKKILLSISSSICVVSIKTVLFRFQMSNRDVTTEKNNVMQWSDFEFGLAWKVCEKCVLCLFSREEFSFSICSFICQSGVYRIILGKCIFYMVFLQCEGTFELPLKFSAVLEIHNWTHSKLQAVSWR